MGLTILVLRILRRSLPAQCCAISIDHQQEKVIGWATDKRAAFSCVVDFFDERVITRTLRWSGIFTNERSLRVVAKAESKVRSIVVMIFNYIRHPQWN